MQHYAANYIFDGENLIKNAYISVDDYGYVTYLSAQNEALIERPFMTFLNGIICPGFVNAHCHLELSGINIDDIQHNGLSSFINSMITSKSRSKNYKKIKLADDVMFLRGISLCGDVVNTTETIEVKKHSRIKYVNFAEQSGIDESVADLKFDKIAELASEFKKSGLEVSIVPHSFYSVSEKLLDLLAKVSENKIISIHFMESQQEKELYSGKKSELYNLLISLYKEYKPLVNTLEQSYNLTNLFKKAAKLILVHNVAIDSEFKSDNKNLYFCLCPASNLCLHNELPNASFVYKNKQLLIAGTDSLASNDRLDIYHELKLLEKNYPKLELCDLLKIITSNGADALGENSYGRLSIGTAPGLVLLCDADLLNLKLGDKSYTKRII